MKLSFKRRKTYLVEIHDYIQDLQRVSMLRDKSSGKEQEAYNNTIAVMQEILIYLNEQLKK